MSFRPSACIDKCGLPGSAWFGTFLPRAVDQKAQVSSLNFSRSSFYENFWKPEPFENFIKTTHGKCNVLTENQLFCLWVQYS